MATSLFKINKMKKSKIRIATPRNANPKMNLSDYIYLVIMSIIILTILILNI